MPSEVAGDVREDDMAIGLLVEPLDGHRREDLVDRPCVGEGLEDREVDEADVAEQLVEAVELIDGVGKSVADVAHAVAGGPEELLGGCALLERHVAETEEAGGFVAGLLGVVVAGDEILFVDRFERRDQIEQGLGWIVGSLDGLGVGWGL